MKKVVFCLLNLAIVASAQITWKKVWPPVNDGTHNPTNGYEDVVWDAYSGKVWIYSTNGGNMGVQIYSIRLHAFDPVAVTDTTIGDNGQTSSGGCFTSTSTWPATHHAMGQFWVDAIRHRVYTLQGVGCGEEALEQWYYQLRNPLSGNAWQEIFPPGLATNRPGEIGAWQTTFQNTTLSGALASGDTAMSLANTAFAVNRDFYLIDSEIVRVMANGNPYLMDTGPGSGTNPFTIARGQYGTTPAAHSSGATVTRIGGTFNNGKVVHDTFHDAFFLFGQRNDNSFGQLYVYCDSTGTGKLSSAQSSVGCTRPDDWVDITSKSICVDTVACAASREAGTNGTGSGRLPRGWYYPSMDFDPSSNKLILFAGGIFQVQYQYSFIYDPATFTWTRLNTTCSGPQCTGLLSVGVTAGGAGYTSAPTVTINGCSGATATANMRNGAVASFTITNMGTACSSPSVSFTGGGGSGAAATAAANTLNAPPIFSSNSENIRIAHAVFQGKMYYHMSQHPGGPSTPYGYTGPVQDWVLDPVAQTWTELQTGTGPRLTDAMTIDPATGNLYAWAGPGGGSDADIWQGQIAGAAGAAAPTISITTTSPISPGTESTVYSFLFAATGATPINWTVTSGNLPPGLTLSSGGILGGTPTSAGTYTFSVQASNAGGTAATVAYSLTIAALAPGSAPAVTSSSPLPSAVPGSSYSYVFSATGTAPITWSATGVPAGLSLSSAGRISGTPTQSGTFSIAVTASNSIGSINTGFILTVQSLSSPPPAVPSALGHSTHNCLDVDGDRYGTGPGCLGQDADDTDPAVHSASDVLTKYGNMAGWISHMGWAPTSVLYVDGGTGSCTRISTPFAYDATKGCRTIGNALNNVVAGDAVIIRGGTYAQGASVSLFLRAGTWNGSACSATTYYLAYPGEAPEVTFLGGSIFIGLTPGSSINCWTTNGIKFTQINHGSGKGFSASAGVASHNWTIQNTEISGFTDNIFPQFNQHDDLITHNYIHDAYAGGDFGHNIYLGSNVTDSSGTIIRGNIISNAEDTCVHLNGPMTNIMVDSNLIYGCSKGINNQSGISHSTFQNNILHTNGGYMFTFNTYASAFASNKWQCKDENYNIVRNNVFFMDGQSYDVNRVSFNAADSAIQVIDNGSPGDPGGCLAAVGHVPDLGHNTYDNNIIVHNCGANCVQGTTTNPSQAGPLFRYASPIDKGASAAAWAKSDTFRNNILKNFDVSTKIIDPGTGIRQSCSWFTNPANLPNASGNLCDADPLFLAADPLKSTSPGLWNLGVQSGSPAIGAGYAGNASTFDITGVLRGQPPTIGAYEANSGAGVPAPTGSSCDLNGDGRVDSTDVQVGLNATLGKAVCPTTNLTISSGCNVVVVQRVINAALGGACVATPIILP